MSRIVHSGLDVKSWFASIPSVAAVRPSYCLGCGVASQPVGGGVVVQGHGLRDRELQGPLEVGGDPVTVVVWVRRYRCIQCCAVMLVVPKGMGRQRQYSLCAIALALALFADGVPVADVRSRTSAWRLAGPDVAGHWTSLRRWVFAASRGELFAGIRAPPTLRPLRKQAEVVADQLVGRSPSDSLCDAPGWRAFRAIEQGI